MKIYAFNFSAFFDESLNLDIEECKIFPQTDFEINFYGQKISVKLYGSF